MTNQPAYLFLDTETTGLNRYNDQIWQISWSIESRDTLLCDRDFTVAHTAAPSKWVLESTQYAKKIADPEIVKYSRQVVLRTLMDDIAAASPREVYLVGANPTFDDFFLHKMTWGVSGVELKYHYHLICIETLIMGALGLQTPPRLKECPALLGLPSFPAGAAHDAKFDRQAVRDLFFALQRRKAAA